MEALQDILFYTLEKSIKAYRQFAQHQLIIHGFDITIDQWLVLKSLNEGPTRTQQQIAEATFKDYASITRIIELLVKKQYLTRTMHQHDRRRFNLELNENAHHLLKIMQPVIDNNRSTALNGISKNQADSLQDILNRIIKNCQS